MTASNRVLITAAESVLNPHAVGDRLFGDVGAALVTDRGNQYLGVCIDTGSATGFCAEHAAIAAMVTAGEYRSEPLLPSGETTQGGCSFCRRAVDAESSSARSTRAISIPPSFWARTSPAR